MGAIKVFLLIRWLLDGTWGWGLVARKIGQWLEVGSVSPTPWPLGRGEGLEVESMARGQWSNHLCLCNKAPLKPQKDGLLRAFGLVNILWRFPGDSRRVVLSERIWTGHALSPDLALCISPIRLLLSFILLKSAGSLVSKQVSLSSLSRSSKLIKPKERGMGTCDLSWSFRSPGDNLDLWLASETGDRLVGLSPSPVGCDTISR